MAILVQPIRPVPGKILLLSFGYVYGMPIADYVFNVALMIPADIIPDVRLSGMVPINMKFIANSFTPQITAIEESINRIMGVLYDPKGSLDKGIIIAIGCTYGEHRSVAVAELLANRLPYPIAIKHRDIR